MTPDQLAQWIEAAKGEHTARCLDAKVGQCAKDVAQLELYSCGFTKNVAGLRRARVYLAFWRALKARRRFEMEVAACDYCSDKGFCAGEHQPMFEAIQRADDQALALAEGGEA